MLTDVGLLILRLTVGGLLMGHGAQKLFGVFGGHGLKGTAGWLESAGLRPGQRWALAGGLSEFGGGLLTALGFLNPLGPTGIVGAMGMATAKFHWGKPIWATSGGAELPVTNMAAALAIGLARPSRLSLDHVLGTRMSRLVLVPGLVAACAGIAYGIWSSRHPAEQAVEQAAEPATTTPSLEEPVAWSEPAAMSPLESASEETVDGSTPTV